MCKRLFTIMSLTLCLFIFAGCSNTRKAKENNQSEKSATTETALALVEQTKESEKAESETMETAESKVADNEREDKPLNCDWTMQVDQTIPITQDGFTVNYTLILVAQKKGGIDVLGDYKGSAYLKINMDASSLSNEVIKVTGGFDVNASTNSLKFQLVPYDIERYSDYGLSKDEVPLAPLVQYETMALISPEMQGTGVLNPMVQGKQGEKAEVNKSASQTMPIPMKITVIGGQVNVDIPSLKIGKHFEGMLLGTPINSEESNKKYDEMMKKIDELEAELEQ
jgi:hypothetical protein